MAPREVFLSHSTHDRKTANRIRDALVAHGVPVWYSPHNIRGAQQWHDEIGDALARCDWFMVLLTPHAIASKWVRREVQYALWEDRFNNRIIPLLYRDCRQEALSWVLPQLQMIDFRKDFAKACRELLRIWGLSLKRRRH